ncbi:MAG: RNA polymerase sigma factor [Acidobacteriaceae bacterium]
MAFSSHWEASWDAVFGPASDSTPDTGLAAIDISTLVQTYSGLLFRVAHSILRNRGESEDVVQEVFLRVVQQQRKLAEVRDHRVWLVRIAWNLALDHRRRIRPEQLDEPFAASLVAPGIPTDQTLAEARQIADALRAIEGLPRQERHALLLSAIDELSIQEISAILQRSESAVRALLFRARTHLRQRLERGVNR